MRAASNAWVVGFDNLSGLRIDLSDALCSLATGGGFATRELYTDADEKLFFVDAAGLTVIVQGDKLIIRGLRPAGSVAEQLLAHKGEVIDALTVESLTG